MILSLENKVFLKKMRKITPSIVLQEVLNALVNILSTIMIGRAMGIHEIAAVGISNQIFLAYSITMAGIVSGCSVFIGQYNGKGDKQSIFKVMGIGFVSTIVATLAFFIAMQFIPHLIIGLFASDYIVIQLGSSFMRVVSVSYFLFVIVFLRNGAMRSIGNTKIPMITTAIALLFSFVFHYIFIFVINVPLYMVATVPIIARTAEILVQEYFIRKYKISIGTSFKNYFNFDISYVKKFYKVSIFIVFNMFTRSVAVSGYMMAYGLLGTEAQGAVQISNAMIQLLQIVAASVGITTGIVISNTLGAGQRDLAIKYAKKCLILGFLFTVMLCIIFIITSPFIISFYLLEPQVEAYVQNILIIASFGMILRTINFTNIGGILRGGGDTKFCFWLTLSSTLFLGLPLTFAGAILWDMQVHWVVALVYIEEFYKAVLGLRRVFTNKWANKIV